MYVNKENTQTQRSKLGRRALVGAAIGFTLITIFLLGADDPKPEWPEFWYIRPLLFVSMGGAIGGCFYHLLDGIRRLGGWRWFVANFLSLVIYIFILWISTVLGLDGTWWD